jgi:hypothetical protein
MNHQENISETKNNWIAKPLGRKGDLNRWLERMSDACPNPKLGQIVWLDHDDRSVGYKAIVLKGNGDVIWQRGQVIRH